MSTYFGLNYHQFKMAASFVVARILRSNKTNETWCKLQHRKTLMFILTGNFPFSKYLSLEKIEWIKLSICVGIYVQYLEIKCGS